MGTIIPYGRPPCAMVEDLKLYDIRHHTPFDCLVPVTLADILSEGQHVVNLCHQP
ncbi:MAG: hypothetical protein HY914_12195 [Desulfomonile tiedjei]|nr:hypothetical protein [Desulfomonile tiedjei]